MVFELLCGYTPFRDANKYNEHKLYINILSRACCCPSWLRKCPAQADFIQQLLQKDRTHRLGNTHGGVDKVKQHAFFNKSVQSAKLAQGMPVTHFKK